MDHLADHKHSQNMQLSAVLSLNRFVHWSSIFDMFSILIRPKLQNFDIFIYTHSQNGMKIIVFCEYFN